MSNRLNHPRTLAWEPLDSEHILACKRVPYEQVRSLVERCNKGKWIAQMEQHAKFDCCRDPANLDIEAWFSNADEQVKGIPDLYKIYCKVCETEHQQDSDRGYCHVKFCAGGNHWLASKFPPQERPDLHDQRPFWDVR